MQIIISKLSIIVLCILIPQLSTSQIFIPVKENQVKKEIALTIGLEPEIVATVSYRQAVLNESERTVFIGSSLKLAPMILDNQAVKFSAFTQLTYFTSKKINFMVMPQLFYARSKDRAATIDGFGFVIDASPFIVGRNWTNGLILGWQHTALAHIKHSEVTKETFSDRYPTAKDGPRDGWYRATANRFKLGYTTARQITNRGIIQISAGGMLNRQKQGILLGFSHAQVPFFLEGSFRYKLEK